MVGGLLFAWCVCWLGRSLCLRSITKEVSEPRRKYDNFNSTLDLEENPRGQYAQARLSSTKSSSHTESADLPHIAQQKQFSLHLSEIQREGANTVSSQGKTTSSEDEEEEYEEEVDK